MTILLLIFLSTLVYFYPGHGYSDGFIVTKLSWLSVVAVLIWWHFHNEQIRGKALEWPLAVPIAVYLALTFLSAINAINLYSVAFRVLFDCLAFSIFWYVASLPKETIIRGLKYAPLCVIPAVVIMFLQGNIKGPFGNPEYGGTAIITSGLLALGVSPGIPVYGALAAILLFLVFWMELRSGLVGMLAGLIILLFFHARRVFYLAMTIGLIMVVLMPSTLFSYFDLGMNRTVTWKAMVEQMADRPLLGVGRGNYRLYSPLFVTTRSDYPYPEYFREAHNDYLELLFEAGPFALLAFLYLLYRILWPIPTGLMAGVLFIALISTLVRALFLFPFQLPSETAWFWASAGAYWRLRQA